jgi:hypothetical protein
MTDHAVGDRLRGYVRSLLPRSLEDVAPGLSAVIHHEGGVRRDLVAGITVGAVSVPASQAMAELAGLPVVYGLYATFLPLAVYGLLGSSRQHVIGPDATVAALTAVTIAPMATVAGKVDPAWHRRSMKSSKYSNEPMCHTGWSSSSSGAIQPHRLGLRGQVGTRMMPSICARTLIALGPKEHAKSQPHHGVRLS